MKFSYNKYICLFVILLILLVLVGLYIIFNKKETMYEKKTGEPCNNDIDCKTNSCGKILYTDHTNHCKNSS